MDLESVCRLIGSIFLGILAVAIPALFVVSLFLKWNPLISIFIGAFVAVEIVALAVYIYFEGEREL